MSTELKNIVSKDTTFDLVELRLGRVISVESELSSPKRAYKLKIDFGKFGIKTSVGRFTHHSIDEMKNKYVIGVLNFGPRIIGTVNSEVLILGVQVPGAESGEATFLTIPIDAKIGSKVF